MRRFLAATFPAFILLLLPLLMTSLNGMASASTPSARRHLIQNSSAIFRGQVLGIRCFLGTNDGQIYTAASIRVEEVFKGTLPAIVQLTHRGGEFGGLGEMGGSFPNLKPGESRLFFAATRADGSLFSPRGNATALKLPADPAQTAAETAAGVSALAELRSLAPAQLAGGGDFSSQIATPESVTTNPTNTLPIPSVSPSSATTNLLADSNNIPARFIVCDRGEPIPYLLDVDYLPAGITTNQAVQAVQSALSAWTAVTSVKFHFQGFKSFGMASPNVSSNDGVLRIQLHDHYNFIGAGNGAGDTLGEGGRVYYLDTLANTTWTGGGSVKGNAFYQAARSYVVLAGTNSFFNSVSNLAEVLCHEVGHTLGMAHSSENPNETNTYLTGAIMYFAAHGNNRGAVLGAYDPPVIRQVHPQTNIPPYMYPRIIHAVTAPQIISIPSVNTVQLRGYSLESKYITFQTNNATVLNGKYTFATPNLHYAPNGFYGDGKIDPSTTAYYDTIYARSYDGTNASPYMSARVVSFGADSYSEGIPDSWRTNYFGNANPGVGYNHHATNDYDGDGYSNLTEFQIGSDPTDPTSNLPMALFGTNILAWEAAPYEVYEIQSSTNLTAWMRATNPVVAGNTNICTLAIATNGPKQFYRIVRVP